MPPPHDDEFYDDTPRGGRRKGLLTVVAVFGLAVVGTAGAFGYRSLFSGPSSSGPPPVIRASGEPSKVAPPPQAPEQSASKFSYDRFGDAGKDERVVRREEKPVDIAPPATQTPRTVFPGVPTPANTGKPNAAMASANPPSALGEPRKVRTVPIRPDLGDVAANSPVAPEPVSVAPPRQVNPPPQPLPSRAADAEPVAAASPPPVAARAATPRAAARVAAHTASAPAPLANAPLSLAPDAKNDFPPPPNGAAAARRRANTGRLGAIIGWRQLSGAGDVAAERGRRPVVLSQHPAEIRQRARQPAARRPQAPISAARACITAPWSGRLAAASRRSSFARASSRPAAIALCSTERRQAVRLDPSIATRANPRRWRRALSSPACRA